MFFLLLYSVSNDYLFGLFFWIRCAIPNKSTVWLLFSSFQSTAEALAYHRKTGPRRNLQRNTLKQQRFRWCWVLLLLWIDRVEKSAIERRRISISQDVDHVWRRSGIGGNNSSGTCRKLLAGTVRLVSEQQRGLSSGSKSRRRCDSAGGCRKLTAHAAKAAVGSRRPRNWARQKELASVATDDSLVSGCLDSEDLRQ